ncbi:MAG: DnaA/Hda family protein [Pseudomonadota bacterium]
MSADAQYVMELPLRAARGRADFMVSGSNAIAVEMIDQWADWPRGRLVLVGPARSGKTHLASVWAEQSGAEIAAAPGAIDGTRPLVIEDVDRLAGDPDGEAALFHLINRYDGARAPLLLTGQAVPGEIVLPDLRSRLAATAQVEIGPPDDALLSSVLIKLFADRQLRVEPKVIGYIINRMERSCAAAEALVERLDTASLRAKKRVTIALVRDHAGWEI